MIKRVVYLLIWLMILYMAVIYNSIPMFFLAGVVFLLPFFLFLILILQTVLLQITFPVTSYAFETEKQKDVSFLAYNRSLMPIRRIKMQINMKNLTTKETKTRKIKQPIDAGMNDISVFGDGFAYGIWQISCKRIRLYDFLCFQSLCRWKRMQTEVICLPRRYHIKRVNIQQNDSVEGTCEQAGGSMDTADIRGIREYQYGDRARDIHWKLSAKKEQLLVKEYGQSIEGELTLGLDIPKLTPENLELIYSLLFECIKQRYLIQLIWLEEKTEQMMCVPIRNEEEIVFAMEDVMRTNTAAFLQRQKPEMMGGRQLWIFENLKLAVDDGRVLEFSCDSLQSQLAEMELVL